MTGCGTQGGISYHCYEDNKQSSVSLSTHDMSTRFCDHIAQRNSSTKVENSILDCRCNFDTSKSITANCVHSQNECEKFVKGQQSEQTRDLQVQSATRILHFRLDAVNELFEMRKNHQHKQLALRTQMCHIRRPRPSFKHQIAPTLTKNKK